MPKKKHKKKLAIVTPIELSPKKAAKLAAENERIKAELKKKAKAQLAADAAPPVRATDETRGPLTPASIIAAADRVLADPGASKGALEKAQKARDKAAAALNAQADEQTDADLKTRIKQKRAARDMLEGIDPDTIDRDSQEDVDTYNALVAKAGGGNFLTSSAEKKRNDDRLALDDQVTADFEAAESKPAKKGKKPVEVDIAAEAAKAYAASSPEDDAADLAVAQAAVEVDTDHGREFAVGESVANDDFANPSEAKRTEPEFNGNGQYKITLPDGSKTIGYTRATTYIDGLEYTGALDEWKLRVLAEGFALNEVEVGTSEGAVPERFLGVVTAAMHTRDVALKRLAKRDRKGELEKGERAATEAKIAKDYKAAVNPVVDEAQELAGIHDKAQKGTDLHALVDVYDAGGWAPIKALHDEGTISDADLDDVRAYASACDAAGLKMLEREVVIVRDDLKVAGRLDRTALVKLPGTTRAVRVVSDLKTGKLYSPGKIGQQLAIYAAADGYDLETGERRKLGLSQKYGLVIHLPAGSATCMIYVVDLALGRKGNAIVAQVRAWRNEGKRAIDFSTDLAKPAEVSK